MRPSNSTTIARLNLHNHETGPKHRSSNTIADKVDYITNSPSAFSRIIDKYGIDANIKQLRETCHTNTVTIFAHKDTEGKYKLETGLYISDPTKGDAYGDFRFCQGLAAKKYQSPKVAKLEFDITSLDTLKDTYHKVVGATGFLIDLLELNPCKDLSAYHHRPELFPYLAPKDENSNGYLTFPNLPYIDPNTLLGDLTNLKNRRDGIAICSYAIHPNQNMPLIEQIKGIDSTDSTNTAALPSSKTRTAYEIESGTNIKYLSSFLDLDINDIPALEALQKHTLEHLINVYNIDQSTDNVHQYFHFPVAEVTATLHLHTLVNKPHHPLNDARSFELSEVIDTLRSGKSMYDMVLARNNGVFYIGINESSANITGIPNTGARDNPYIQPLSHPFENPATLRNS